MCAVLADPIVRVLRSEPELAVAILHRVHGWMLEQPVRAHLADEGLTQVIAQGKSWCADVAIELRRLDGKPSWLAVVVAQARDEYEREYIWPCYAALLGVHAGGAAGLLAVVDAIEDIEWAGKTISCDFGRYTITPQVVTREQLLALRRALQRERAAVKLAAGP